MADPGGDVWVGDLDGIYRVDEHGGLTCIPTRRIRPAAGGPAGSRRITGAGARGGVEIGAAVRRRLTTLTVNLSRHG